VLFVDKKRTWGGPGWEADPFGAQSATKAKGMAAAMMYLVKQSELNEAEAKKKAEWWAWAKTTGMIIDGAVVIGLLGSAVYKRL